jgi:hypothetical protein
LGVALKSETHFPRADISRWSPPSVVTGSENQGLFNRFSLALDNFYTLFFADYKRLLGFGILCVEFTSN